MKTMMPRNRVHRLVVLVILVVISLYGAHLWAACNTYQDSKVVIWEGDPYCGASGHTCIECTTTSSGGGSVTYCVGDSSGGGSSCVPGGGNGGMPSV